MGKSGWCSHYSTSCTEFTYKSSVVGAMRLVATTGVERVWQSVGSKITCDASAGEVYMQQSSGKFPDLQACQEACENAAGCQSITFYKRGWCSHYSTPCTQSKSKRSAVGAMRLVTVNPPTTTAGAGRVWESVGYKTQCDTSAGEVYMQQSSGKFPDLDACQEA